MLGLVYNPLGKSGCINFYLKEEQKEASFLLSITMRGILEIKNSRLMMICLKSLTITIMSFMSSLLFGSLHMPPRRIGKHSFLIFFFLGNPNALYVLQ